MKEYTILILLLLSFTSVHADETRSAKITHELFETMQMSITYQQTIEKTLEAQIKANPSIAPIKDTMLKFFDKYMGWESMKDDMAKIYMKNFSDEEIKALIAFYKTPIGQKSAITVPILASEGAALGEKRVQENIAELQKMIMEEIAKTQ